MTLPSTADDILKATVEAYERAGGNQTAAADALCIARSTLQHRLKLAARRGLMGPSEALPGYEITRISEGPRGTTVEQRPAKGEEFVLPETHTLGKITFTVDADNRIERKHIRAEPGKLDPAAVAGLVRAAFEGFTTSSIDIPPPGEVDEDTATILPLPDLHLGMLAWKEESGENYDLKIAERTMKEALSRLLASSPNSKTGVILGLGDLLHFDGYEPVTSRSRNLLDVDGRYPRVLQTATSVLLWAIEQALQKHETLIVRILPGNHDDQSAIAVTLALEMYYRDEPRVRVDSDPSRFWWWRFGSTFLGATHGDKTKMQDLPILMAASKPEDWGASRHRHIYTGHIHHKSAVEIGGVIVESFRSPAAKDAYHAGAGYHSGRSLQAITVHKDHGEISRQTANILG